LVVGCWEREVPYKTTEKKRWPLSLNSPYLCHKMNGTLNYCIIYKQ
jgi:hypothetical protein